MAGATCGTRSGADEFGIENESYKQCYKSIYSNPDLKKELQKRWRQVLETADADIVIIDTVETHYWFDTYPYNHYFCTGIYCVPLNLVHPSASGKSSKTEFPPKKWVGYLRVLSKMT
ncbi:uncharacterized protein CDAR_429611 [Caerostris darwini]|uniref:Uncharacterized protein n=1 Tax=Caerostris darwini TaxID=1538125 RepID=A0AAV4VU11_9ARAC|nr:uncharacterized protein CDAR_429611 [Caerostris darwini]